MSVIACRREFPTRKWSRLIRRRPASIEQIYVCVICISVVAVIESNLSGWLIVDEATQRVDLFPDGLEMIFSFYIKGQKLKRRKETRKIVKLRCWLFGTFSLHRFLFVTYTYMYMHTSTDRDVLVSTVRGIWYHGRTYVFDKAHPDARKLLIWKTKVHDL